MPLRDTAHRSETERRQQLGCPIRCAHHNMKLALAAIAVKSVSPSESCAPSMKFIPPYQALAEQRD